MAYDRIAILRVQATAGAVSLRHACRARRLLRGVRRIGATAALLAGIVLAALVGVSDASPAVLIGTKGPDVLRGTSAGDQLSGLGGADRLYGYRGSDRLMGGRGDDLLLGGPGRDALDAGPGNDRIDARDGQVDTISCGSGRDTIRQDPIDQRASDCPDACTIDVTSGCVPRTTLSFTDETWTCTRPLARYGKLPLKVIATFTNNLTRFGVRLDAGCTGDGDPSTVDLILDVRGNGQTFGTGDDAIRVTANTPGARNIQITGHADCGKKQGAFHQDGIHAIGGTDITFVDFTIGDWATGVATCQAAGGAVFYSGAGAVAPRNMTVIRGRFMGCNHGLLDGHGQATLPTGSVVGARFRSGRHDAGSGLCIDATSGRPYACPAVHHEERARRGEGSDLPGVGLGRRPMGGAVAAGPAPDASVVRGSRGCLPRPARPMSRACRGNCGSSSVAGSRWPWRAAHRTRPATATGRRRQSG